MHERNLFGFNTGLMNPLRDWNFIREVIHFWRPSAVTSRLKRFPELQYFVFNHGGE